MSVSIDQAAGAYTVSKNFSHVTVSNASMKFASKSNISLIMLLRYFGKMKVSVCYKYDKVHLLA